MLTALSLNRRVLLKCLEIIERQCLSKSYECRFSPLFIVGPPRSGTTLAKQLITWSIPSSFFTNLTQITAKHAANVLPAASAAIVKYARLDRYQEDFRSEYGYTSGLGRPAGASTAWWRLMGVRYDPIAPESLSEKQKEATRRAVAATENILGRPFVNKTSAHSVCVRALAEIFDQAVFVRIARDPLDVAQSIYRVRTGGDKPRRWIGGRPPEVTSFANQSIAAQSAAQVHYLEEFISGELSEIASTRVLRIRYEDLCRQPAVEVERVCVFMNRNGSPAGLKRPVPCSFPCARGKSVGDEEYEIMKETLQALR